MADQIKALSKKRSFVKGKLTRILHAVQPSTQPGALPGAQPREADVTPPQLRVHQRNVEKFYGEFCEFHGKILDLVEENDENKQQEAKWLDFEQLYNRTLVTLETLLTTHEKPSGSTQAVLPAGQAAYQVIIHQQALSAPLPTFDGCYENWAKFKVMFQDLMRNSSDSDAIKLYHLDQALVGQAKGKIYLRIIQDNNYQGAWKELEYENPRYIIDLHIQGILQLKKMDKRSSKELRNVVERCSRHVEGLRFHKQELLGVSELIVVNILASTLDRETRELWEATIEKGELPEYQATIDFLRKRCHILERCELSDPETSIDKPTVHMTSPKKTTVNVSSASATTSEVKCELCCGNHPNYKCSSFISMSVPQRLEKVIEARACYNCLRTGHQVRKCPSERTCKCGERHHNLLHMDSPKEQAPPKFGATPSLPPITEQAASGPSNVNAVVEDASSEQTTSCCNSGLLQTSQPVLLQTAIVNVVDKHGRLHPCRTLLDSGSQAHILSAAMARKLELPLNKCNVTVVGANAVRTPARKSVNLSFSSRYINFRDSITCLISEKPTGVIPSERIDTSGWRIPSGVCLADPQFFEPYDIDLVMASNYVWDLLRSDMVKLRNGTVTLRETDLGWIVTGTYDPFNQVSRSVVHSNVVRLDDQKEIVDASAAPSTANEKVEKQVSTVYNHDASGRCVIQFPFRDTVSKLDDARSPTMKSFAQIPTKQSSFDDHTVFSEDKYLARNVESIDDPESIPEQELCSYIRVYAPKCARREVPKKQTRLNCPVKSQQIQALPKLKQISATHQPARLAPILNSDGDLRVGDRNQKPNPTEGASVLDHPEDNLPKQSPHLQIVLKKTKGLKKLQRRSRAGECRAHVRFQGASSAK